MLNVALTGNIASGKSTVLDWFSRWGATVIDADQLVREVEAPGSPVLAQIRRRFGPQVIRPDGELDRAALRNLIFQDAQARQDLNAMVHPAVRQRRAALAAEAEARGDCVLVNDIPLLFETLDPGAFDLIVLVDSPAELRRQRLIALRGIPPDEADRMIAAQLPSQTKRSLSHVVLDNRGSLEDLRRAAWEAWRQIRARAAQKDLGARGRLLVVTAHPCDESCCFAGTLARYADAGVEIQVVRIGEPTPAPAMGDLERSLGIREIARAPDAATLGRILATYRPAVVLTFDPAATDPAHARAGQLARDAWSAVGQPGRLLYLATDPTLEESPAWEAIVDVRPWKDIEDQALRQAAVQGCNRPQTARVAGSRARYRSQTPIGGQIKDLFAGLQAAA